MSANKVTQAMKYRFVKDAADMRQYQKESNGNQSDTYIFVDITIDGSGRVGQIVFGSDSGGNILNTSLIMRARPGGGVDFWTGDAGHGTNIKIASLDLNGNFKCKGTITGNTTP